MRTTIDKAGRIVVPKELRDQVGLVPGPVDIHVVGNTIQIEVPEDDVELIEVDGKLLIKGISGLSIDEIRELRMRLQDPLRRHDGLDA